MSKKPTIHQTTKIATSRLFTIEQLDLEFSNGEKRSYERLASRGNGAVLIVPMLDHETFLLIREYAGGTGDYELGFPKGKIDAGESPQQAANRELMEEVGYEAAELTHLKSLSLAPQYMQHKTHILLAKHLTEHREEGDEPEPLEVIPWKLADMEALIAREDFTEARSMAALYMVKDYLNKNTT